MKMHCYQKLFILLFSSISFYCNAQTSYIWAGTNSNNWEDSLNWTPKGIPQSNDNVTINGQDNIVTLNGNRTVNNITIQNIYFDLKGYVLSVNGYADFDSIQTRAGTLNFTGSISFSHVHSKANIKAVCSSIDLQNNMFDSTCYFEKTGNKPDNIWASNIFNSNAFIVQNNENQIWDIANGGLPEVFNGDVNFITKTGFLRVAAANYCLFKGNINLSSTDQGISIGDTSLSYLINNSQIDTGKYVTTSGFTSGKLSLFKINQAGTGSNAFQLTGTASLLLNNCNWGGDVSISTAGTDTSVVWVNLTNSMFNQSTLVTTSKALLSANYFNVRNLSGSKTQIMQEINNAIPINNMINGTFITKE